MTEAEKRYDAYLDLGMWYTKTTGEQPINITRTKFTDDQMIDFAEAYHKEKMREVLIEYSPYTRNAVFGIPNDKEHRERLKVMDERIVDNFLKEREG